MLMGAENVRVRDIVGVMPVTEEKTIVPATKPEKWVMPTCLVMNQAFQGIYDDEETHKVTFIKKKHGSYDDFVADVQIGYQELGDTISHKLTRYDKLVYGTVVSLYVHHEEQSSAEDNVIYITPQMVYRTFRGDWKPKLPASEAESVVKSLHKMISIRIAINPLWGNKDLALLKGNSSRYRGIKSNGHLLNGEWVNVSFKGGHRLDCLKLKKIPLLYWLGDHLNQVARQDLTLMKSGRRYTQLVPLLRQYLIERIAAMKGNNRLGGRAILFDTIYAELLPASPSKEQLESVRAMTQVALDDFKAYRFIADYQLYRGMNGKYTKVEISAGKNKS